ncbi:TPA: hypothetical protein ACIANO_004493, partial [Salmonella enterica subsp. enterica serovar Hvittingfoss]
INYPFNIIVLYLQATDTMDSKTEKSRISFHSFQFLPRKASPVRGRGGGIVCKKSQLKNFSDMTTAGRCGVVRFWLL